MAANRPEGDNPDPPPVSFSKLYLKLLLAQKAYPKAQEFLSGEGGRSFELWVEKRTW